MPDVLTYWNEISSYLNVSDRTAQRYEKLGMPIFRDAAGHPYTTKSAIDSWKYSQFIKAASRISSMMAT